MLKIGLTGGIASGKSLVAARLRELGAVLVDADALAREVVAPGTPGLARVVEAFGPSVLRADGSLDRPKLGAVVFGDPERLAVLNGIIHPLVRTRAAALAAAAQARPAAGGAVLVQDIPLLVETGQGSSFHLVLVVDAPDDVRVRRMVEHRNMTGAEARSRMAAQATREERLAAADVVLENSGTRDEILAAVDALWDQRLAPFALNLAQQRIAPRPAGPAAGAAGQGWADAARRLAARLQAAAPQDILGVDHIGPTAVPGVKARDVIDLQVSVRDLGTADRIAPVLAAAGFPRWPGTAAGGTGPAHADPAEGGKRLHGSADPGRAVDVHVRAAGSPGWRHALCLRDWLRADTAARETFAAGDAARRMDAWVQRTGWQPPPYPGGPAGQDIAES